MRIRLYRTFKYQAGILAAAWSVLFPLQLILSGGDLVPDWKPFYQIFFFYNWYNMEPNGYLITQIMHAAAGFLIPLTINLGFKSLTHIAWSVAGTVLAWSFIMNLWEVLEFERGFRGTPWDTLMDWLGGNLGLIPAVLLLIYMDRRFGYEYA